MRTAYKGLSPRVRGNQLPVNPRVPQVGSIPACAGEPVSLIWVRCPSRVYPRVCGGTEYHPTDPVQKKGLSPRVRGNRWGYPPRGHSTRSIPACAGEPRPNSSRPNSSRVYPRVCGGTSQEAGEKVADEGLSPRVRGNHCNRRKQAKYNRSIPACAGEPLCRMRRGGGTSVYPRVCGGTFSYSSEPFPYSGLSPRVRGNRRASGFAIPYIGSIPACAGEPTRTHQSAGRPGVYPRVCGGTLAGLEGVNGIRGLSPRVRGNP